jgi:hypothetical protein
MKTRAFSWLAVLSLLTGCGPSKPAAKEPDLTVLKFPVVVIHPNSKPVLHTDAEDLGRMNSGHLLSEGAHRLIDSNFQFYTLENLHSKRSGLRQMIDGPGMTPVTFELKRDKTSGAAAARAAMLEKSFSSLGEAQAATQKQAMEKASTLEEILNAFRDHNNFSKDPAD